MGVQCDAPVALLRGKETPCTFYYSRLFGPRDLSRSLREISPQLILNPESSSAYRIAIPNTVPSHRYSTQLAINHRIPKLIPCFQKAEFWLYNFVPTFHKSLARVLPTLSLCHMHVYILNCHVSFMKWRKLKLSKLSVFKVNPKTQNKSCKSRLVTFIKKSFAFFATQIKESEGRSW